MERVCSLGIPFVANHEIGSTQPLLSSFFLHLFTQNTSNRIAMMASEFGNLNVVPTLLF
jgi:hypothetical protein